MSDLSWTTSVRTTEERDRWRRAILRRISWFSGPETADRIWASVEAGRIGGTRFGLDAELRAMVAEGLVVVCGHAGDRYDLTTGGRRWLRAGADPAREIPRGSLAPVSVTSSGPEVQAVEVQVAPVPEAAPVASELPVEPAPVEDLPPEKLAPIGTPPRAAEPLAVTGTPEPIATELAGKLAKLPEDLRSCLLRMFQALADDAPLNAAALRYAVTGQKLDNAAWRNTRDFSLRNAWIAFKGSGKWTFWRLTRRGLSLWTAYTAAAGEASSVAVFGDAPITEPPFNARGWWRLVPCERDQAVKVLTALLGGPVRSTTVRKAAKLKQSEFDRFRAYARATGVIVVGFGRWSEWSLGPNATAALQEGGLPTTPDPKPQHAILVDLLVHAEGTLSGLSARATRIARSADPNMAPVIADIQTRLNAALRDVRTACELAKRNPVQE